MIKRYLLRKYILKKIEDMIIAFSSFIENINELGTSAPDSILVKY